MKTTRFIPAILIATMILFLTGFSSYAIKPALAPAEHIQKIITENLKYPQQALKDAYTGSVDVLFKIDDKGQIVVKKISTDNRAIAENVKTQLANICCKDIKSPYNQYYKVTINFKLIG